MATWGVGIFDDDLAQSVRRDFAALVAEGMSVYAAAESLLEKYARDNSAIVYLALAALQLEHGLIQHKIKKRALTVIISGEGRERWEDAAPEALQARERVLEELRNRLREVPS